MPVILSDDSMSVWLDRLSSQVELKNLCQPYDGLDFLAKQVSSSLHKKPADTRQLGLNL